MFTPVESVSDELVSMAVVYPRRKQALQLPDDAVAAFKEWDEAEE